MAKIFDQNFEKKIIHLDRARRAESIGAIKNEEKWCQDSHND